MLTKIQPKMGRIGGRHVLEGRQAEGTVYIAQQFARDKVVREPKSQKSKRNLHLGDGMLQVLGVWKNKQDDYLHTIAAQQIGITLVVSNELGQNMDPNNYNRWFRSFCVEHGFGEYETWVTKRYVQMEIDGKVIRKTLSEEQWAKLTPAMKKQNKMVVLNTNKTGKGYKGLTPHMLRHTQATLLIGASTDIKTVQSRLGHSSVNLTLNIYSHAIAANDKLAADTFSSLLQQKTS